MTEQKAAIQVRDLSFSYDEIPVLTDVHFDIYPLDTVCIVGPNGGGKTTLIKLILGLLTPDQGSVRIYGGKPKDERRRIGYVPQSVQHDARFPI